MDSPILIMNKPAIVAGPMTGSINSGAIDLADVRSYNVQFTATGTPVGTINVLVSNDGLNFDVLGTAVAFSGAITKNIGDKNIGYRYIQVIYTFTSGTGILNASVCGKQ